MCPVCIATAAWFAAGATSTGGISALVVSRLRSKNKSNINIMDHEKGESDGQKQPDSEKH
jgi:hypothetical protein